MSSVSDACRHRWRVEALSFASISENHNKSVKNSIRTILKACGFSHLGFDVSADILLNSDNELVISCSHPHLMGGISAPSMAPLSRLPEGSSL